MKYVIRKKKQSSFNYETEKVEFETRYELWRVFRSFLETKLFIDALLLFLYSLFVTLLASLLHYPEIERMINFIFASSFFNIVIVSTMIALRSDENHEPLAWFETKQGAINYYQYKGFKEKLELEDENK